MQKTFTLRDITLNRLKLRPLVIFERVLVLQSIANAAIELNLTQPAVTKAIQELEEQLGMILFERTNRGVIPTDAAFFLGERVKTLLAELRYLTDDINSFNGGKVGTVIVGTLISASAELLPKTILKMKQKEPNVLISVVVGTVSQLFPALLKGEVDVVIGRIPEIHSPFFQKYALTHYPLYPEKLSLMVAKDHPLLSIKNLSLEDIIEYPWILPQNGSSMRATLIEYFNKNNFPVPKNVVESVSILTNISLVKSGQFITCMSSLVAQSPIIKNELAALPIDGLGRDLDVGYSIRKDHQLPPACQQFIECLIDVSKEQVLYLNTHSS